MISKGLAAVAVSPFPCCVPRWFSWPSGPQAGPERTAGGRPCTRIRRMSALGRTAHSCGSERRTCPPAVQGSRGRDERCRPSLGIAHPLVPALGPLRNRIRPGRIAIVSPDHPNCCACSVRLSCFLGVQVLVWALLLYKFNSNQYRQISPACQWCIQAGAAFGWASEKLVTPQSRFGPWVLGGSEPLRQGLIPGPTGCRRWR